VLYHCMLYRKAGGSLNLGKKLRKLGTHVPIFDDALAEIEKAPTCHVTRVTSLDTIHVWPRAKQCIVYPSFFHYQPQLRI